MRIRLSKSAVVMLALNELRGLVMTWPVWLALIHHWFKH